MAPKCSHAVLLAAGLATGIATFDTAAAQPVRAGPAGAAFNKASVPLPPGERGSVIWARPLAAEASLPSAARNLLVLYRSTSPAEESVAVSGTVAIPAGTPPAGGWPVITWTHGTTGLASICAPSLDTPNGPEHAYLAGLRTLLDGFVSRGYAVVATDYEGLGTPGPHPFLQGRPNGRNALDMLRAARQIERGIGTRYAVLGHSQGGHAALFAGALGPDYVPELTQVGTLASAPGSQIMSRLSSVRQAPDVQLALPYVLYTLQSYAGTNRAIDLTRMLAPAALTHLPDLHESCMTHALTAGYWSTAIARDQFLPDPDLAALSRVAAENEPGTLRIAAPTMIMQGTTDQTVPPGWTDSHAGQLCTNGTSLAYRPFAGADHNDVMVAGAAEAHSWVAARFAGEPAVGNCTALPKAAGG